ncbi:MAG: DUF92 domain-containing protein [Candidatus Brockarchaeota archaeon]|nr:DUF92 domain-containing protein [Candidatus Brockarchaeota archaeon]
MMIAETLVKTLAIVMLAVATYISRSLSFSGVLASIFLGVIVLFLGGWDCFIIMLAFLVLGVASTKYRRKDKELDALAQEKSGVRSWVNVLANGGPAAISIMLEHFFRMEIFLVFFTTTVCSAAADTLATELGLLSSSKPRLITNIRRSVEKGVSGGVTLLGTFAGLSGAIAIALVSVALQQANAPGIISGVGDAQSLFVACSTGGFLGMIVDSLLGATVQEAYVSKTDGRLCEKPGKQGEYVLVKGFKGFDNHVVNLVSNLIAGILGIMIYVFTAAL